MFAWLFEGRPAIYVLLLGLVAIALFLWYRDRKRTWFVGSAILLTLAGVYFVLDLLIETSREQIFRKLREMAGAVQAKDVERIHRHLAQEFKVADWNKEQFRTLVQLSVQKRLVEQVQVKDLEVLEKPVQPIPGTSEKTGLKIAFQARPQVPPGSVLESKDVFYRCEAHFVQEANGEWRMLTFRVFAPLSTEEINLSNAFRWIQP